MRRDTQVFIGVVILAVIALLVVWPQRPGNYLPGFLPWPENRGIHLKIGDWRFDREGMRLGLDLQGGTHLVLEADLSARAEDERAGALEGVRRIIERRINAYGVAESVVQMQGNNWISVQLPGVKDIREAKRLIGQTAQLDFRETVLNEDGTVDWVLATAIGTDGREKPLTGRYFRPNSQVIFDQTTGQPEVSFAFDSEGAKLFEQITTRLKPSPSFPEGKPLGIFLDDALISAPLVKAVIRDSGIITGLDLSEARTLGIQLNAGALPVPVRIIKEQDVDATLGADSIKKSILAGEIGLGLVLLFMVLYYRLPGLLASSSLLIYALFVFAIFKLIPGFTLTLAGIAAFILSIGMAVDANILIFERTKEELRAGRTIGAAVEAGFARAWNSIRDSNISTLITCAILYWFGSNFGASLVMGFALTLGIGVLVSMFTAIIVTRTFLRLFLSARRAKGQAIFGL